jgi:hypothetical protein
MSQENVTTDAATCPCGEALAAAEQLKDWFAVADQGQTPKKWIGVARLHCAMQGRECEVRVHARRVKRP